MIVDTIFALAIVMTAHGEIIQTDVIPFDTRHECRAAKAAVYANIQKGYKRLGEDGKKYTVYVSDCEAIPVEKFVNQDR